MGELEFDGHFSGLFEGRWPALRAAMLEPGDAVEYCDGLRSPYRLDSASVRAAQALRLPESGEILDACAAPGGKSLVIAASMLPGTRLLCNELSSDRRRRLSGVLDAHLPPETRSRVIVSGFDAAAAGGRPGERGRFASILLDAPCSSERHVLRDPAALARWSPARVKFLSRRQWSLLSSAFLLLAPGGSLVYATCALSPEENDDPMERLFQKYGGALEDDPIPSAKGAERTAHGVMYLPDTSAGAGPLYIARIRKAAV
jgi:16S rRNA (cytosine1407-C5)-methyltransferase